MIPKKMNNTSINATRGISTETKDISVAAPVSTVAITGFPRPAVVVEDPSRTAAELPLIAAAVPPPAIMASAQEITGSRSLTTATMSRNNYQD